MEVYSDPWYQRISMSERAPSTKPPTQDIAPSGRPRTLAEFITFIEMPRPRPELPDHTTHPTDIVIATFPKCGTTWVQQIVHGLRTHGSMDFEEICLVVPWLETARLLDIDLNMPQVAEPRVYKTHLNWEEAPKGLRYIYVMRDPGDAMLSHYHFLDGWYFEPGSIDLEDFCLHLYTTYLPEERYWAHLRSWWAQHEREEILFLCFEDLKHDLEGAVRQIAAFTGIAASDELIALVTRQATFAFMKAHESQFDDHPTTQALNRFMGLPADGRTTKVRAGGVGNSASLSPKAKAALEDAWRRSFGEPLGIGSYAALRALVAEKARRFSGTRG